MENKEKSLANDVIYYDYYGNDTVQVTLDEEGWKSKSTDTSLPACI